MSKNDMSDDNLNHAPRSITKMMEGSEERFDILRNIVENLAVTETETAAKVAAAVALAKLAHEEIVIAADVNAIIVYTNGGGLLGYSSEELIGKPTSIIVPERFRESHRAGFRRYIETNVKHMASWKDVPLIALHKDGREVPVSISFEDVTVYGRRMIVGVIVQPLTPKDIESVAEQVTDKVTDKVTEKVMESLVEKLSPEEGAK